ncbi:MAG: hypothetical protein UY41_C0003G0001 [Candidatus Moranbacteria bacterium GW2011_GWE1_49_15]|nr:MAG: hypothetical protein UX75_C0010G0029 [Candidatus Moranbacteria bacterium GW2011_GWE2_47_10]KKW07428.1 MAG: hypothetical protein UY41_C0003G0001 [Candidatus Moranbacteria bacterium GW2011_GWE1_49_15]HBP01484.1 hypothetical protein [Candidatus Moranbacteria bacterium]
MNELLKHQKYLFLLAHPDDDVYCCVLARKLVDLGKEVYFVYATSGDLGGNPQEREKEVTIAVKNIGIVKEQVHFLRISEASLLDRLYDVVNLTLEIARKNNIDCIVGQDYEGGHEGHDAVSFCASEAMRLSGMKNHFVFPVYYGKPGERKCAMFKPQRKDFITLEFSEKDRNLKKDILGVYASQRESFEKIRQSDDGYYPRLFSREVYFKINDPIDFNEKPTNEVGYEHHRNGFKFDDFKNAVEKYRKLI